MPSKSHAPELPSELTSFSPFELSTSYNRSADRGCDEAHTHPTKHACNPPFSEHHRKPPRVSTGPSLTALRIVPISPCLNFVSCVSRPSTHDHGSGIHRGRHARHRRSCSIEDRRALVE